MKHTFLLLACCCAALLASAQTTRTLTGFVVDAKTGDALPFVAISLKSAHSGIVSNEGGKFDFQIPIEINNDTLLFNSFGYRRAAIALSAIEGPLSIRLQQNILQLQEVEVRPQPAAFYVLMALRKFKQNYPSQAFQSIAYFRENVTENNAFVQFDECVFKTYCPNFTDTVQNQDQLLLHRRTETLEEVQFMKKERDKAEKKKQETGKESKQTIDIDLTSALGGPKNILKSARLDKENASYLDSTQLKEYSFAFAKPSSYDQSEVMVIEFKSKGKVDHVRESGKLYLDRNSLAIIRIESSGDLVIPILIKPVLFMVGLSIENPSFVSTVIFQQADNHWYPQQIQNKMNFELERRHWFGKNEHSIFDIDQAYVVNQLRLNNVAPIPADKRFKGSDDMDKEVHNDENIKWETVNVIKR
jgi:hypothetical protein